MALTEEQRERIRKNRERALEIQRKRRKEKEDEEKAEAYEKNAKKQKTDLTTAAAAGSSSNGNGTDDASSAAGPLEEFEVGASEWVTKKEAKSTYCLPDGTLAVCECQERENPRHKGWTPMKLYRRSEIRQRAHKRFGGMEGLVEERQKRRAKQLAKDMKDADKLFE
mmetsp:Transcript_36436/g.56561  ORF Transcript_36436/g.56561 Transcript_36436/m.56561 type:complete len:167 (-) Transcript_36436:71-571(-)|eukprot:CAMPEP_0117026068 /NCGR_PEP_ID=MMETSP0472-20121206/19191_1 /TAXON_ID=693140 ORGANISM="Tiarina fusus, Strain LIS" /NCGR_SAMPLE_ID=MMETSP0472 /ASSEMBLY_ACC=CAM_ASM_000603 /LENGTH=166 /DNA_ID=CAMNT_0004732953 /DNA_START=253 /DNA_END=753 /DNA_ORIENTATION=+